MSGIEYRQAALADASDHEASGPFDREGRSYNVKIAMGSCIRCRFFRPNARERTCDGGAMPVWVNHHNHEDAENQGEQTSIEPTMTAQKHAWHVQKDTSMHDTALIGEVMTESELWACTTCRSCEEQCPVGNEHVDKIIDMRRYLVLTEGRLPAEGQRALQNIERQGNPWGLAARRACRVVICLRDFNCQTSVSCSGKAHSNDAGSGAPRREAGAAAVGRNDGRRMTSEAGASCLR